MRLLGDKLRIFLLILPLYLNSAQSRSAIYTNTIMFPYTRSYHKFWIRHNDNGNDGLMGVMEFCIVRNNVYQLYVKGIRGLGDPLPYTPGKDDPGTPDESDDVTIDVTIYVKDWVKRTNKDIIL